MSLIVYITYEELTQKRPALADLHAGIRDFRRRDLVVSLARINMLVSIGTTELMLATDHKLCELVFSKHRPAIEAFRRGPGKRVVFNRLSLLYLLKQVILNGSDDAAPITNRDVEQLGLLCLMANDLVMSRRPERADTLLETLHNFLPFVDYFPEPSDIRDCARTALMMEVADRLFEEGVKPCLDLQAEFERRVGLSFQTFLALAWATYLHYIQLSLEEIETIPRKFEVREDFYRTTSVSQQGISSFLAAVSRTLDESRDLLGSQNARADDDWTVLHRYPLLRTPENMLFPVDPTFLIDKAGRGFYWTLFEVMDGRERHSLAEFWGKVFENYVNDQIRDHYSAEGTFIPNPTFPDGSEACDACVKEGSRLVLLEHKSSVLRVEKYGADPSKLKHDLDLKFVKGEPGSPKGVAQFERTIRRFLAGESIGGISAMQISTIYPVMICLEASMAVPLMTKYVNDEFTGAKRSFKKHNKAITPLFVIAVHHFEEFLPYLHSATLSAVLESYYRHNKTLQLPISAATAEIIKSTSPGVDKLRKTFEQIKERIVGDLFPNGEQEPS